ncbi:universal stress protein [Blastococcus tunisiensis]|uniref:Nucleotide-binding universal stress protein, UspA family n=1 Tax=Blastococcus tunisiensis TaxID=1798228 RepID=A0A1I1Y420_9ACTN|nr:universal stress protein [Blastococcus sp. DSM 46838]SFE12560.1 Nucleotide-binding universal stress protein, UspA family [Blastococcus sp. DSM 46838]
MTTSTPLAPQERPRPAAAEDDTTRAVLVGVDGSECGLEAVRWAVHEAALQGAPLRILHAAPYLGPAGPGGAPPPELHRARRITATAYTVARHTDTTVQADTEVVPGKPTDVLLQAAPAARLLVLGSAATGSADELVLASVAGRVAARSPRPVVVVPRHRPGDAGDRPVVAVLGIGDREDDEAVAAFAAGAAVRRGLGLTVLQTRSPKRTVPAGWADDEAEWRRRYPELPVTRAELPAPHAEQLLGATCPAPLLVMSAGTGSLLHRTLDGRHRWLLRHGTSPMALVPPVHRPGQEPREEIVALG